MCEILRARGSAVISAYGGAGKSGLMVNLRHVLNMKEMEDKNQSVFAVFRNVFLKELFHSSSLVCREEVEKTLAYKMQRLVPHLIPSDRECSSVAWKNPFAVVLTSLHEGVEGDLEKKKSSFGEVVDYSEDRPREFVPPILALIDQSTVSIPECDESVNSNLKDIFLYGSYLLHSLNKVKEEVQLWRNLLTILHHHYSKDAGCGNHECAPCIRSSIWGDREN